MASRSKLHERLVEIGSLTTGRITLEKGKRLEVLISRQRIKAFHNIEVWLHLTPPKEKPAWTVTDPVSGLAIGERYNDTEMDALMQAAHVIIKGARTLKRWKETQAAGLETSKQLHKEYKQRRKERREWGVQSEDE